MNRATIYRLLPETQANHEKLMGICGACRWVWNEFLSRNKKEMALFKAGRTDKKPNINRFNTGLRFTKFRKQEEWLQKYHSNTVRHTLKYLEDAFKRAFKYGGFPKFKSKFRDTPSFTIPIPPSIKNNRILIPKVGYMKMVRKGTDKYRHGEAKQATVKLVGDKWFVAILYKLPEPTIKDNGLAIGIDMNCNNISTSEGDILQIPDTKSLDIRKKRWQRKQARRFQKGKVQTNRHTFAKNRVAHFSRKITNKMQDWRHQTTTAITNEYSTVCIEDLKTRNMTKSAKGTLEKPGVNVKAKSGLNRVILKTGWGEMRRMLEYKANKLIAVPPHHTSQKCSKCGHTEKDNRKTQAKFKCLQCGYACNADVNASVNIMVRGMGTTGRGGKGVSPPLNRHNDLFAPG